jgi:hypothetical protein
MLVVEERNLLEDTTKGKFEFEGQALHNSAERGQQNVNGRNGMRSRGKLTPMMMAAGIIVNQAICKLTPTRNKMIKEEKRGNKIIIYLVVKILKIVVHL